MDQDDLPPPRRAPDRTGFFSSLGGTVGTAAWIVPIFLIVGLIAWMLIRSH
ncbi:MAG: hypothetical protein JWN58_1201 [Gammaproteobacteria bacterium]|nr:hypothetical protein [Gammaproteobacteria bacterium]